MQLHNSLSNTLEDFVPNTPGKVSMYVCGMTVYDYCHLGHARSLVSFDVIRRWLIASGYEVTYVRNITDIDDKIIRRAVENGETIRSLTDRMIDALHSDCSDLNTLPPTHEPRATDYIPDMVRMTQSLVDAKKAFVDGDSVRFDSSTRTNVFATTDTDANFVMWKMGKDDPMDAKWDSPFGVGRPGWHLECSAMSNALLGKNFDIHGGGADLRFPHHENEIAQSFGVNGCIPANYWLHNGFVNVGSQKMSKSASNAIKLRELISAFGGDAIRLLVIGSNYGSDLSFSRDDLAVAKKQVAKFREATANMQVGDLPGPFVDAMNANFNTPIALSILYRTLNEFNATGNPHYAEQVLAMCRVLGFKLEGDNGLSDKEMILLTSRDEAKAAKNFAAADEIRSMLAGMGIDIMDTKDGTVWRRL